MGIFHKHSTLGEAAIEPRFKIRITTEDGRTLYWHKRGRLHVVDEDVARAFVENFKPALFQVTPDGNFMPPTPGVTAPVARVDMESV